MQKKILGVIFLAIIALNFKTTAFAEENSITNTTERTEYSSLSQQFSETSMSETIESKENSQISSEAAQNSTEKMTDGSEGTLAMPRGRSDLYPTIQLYASLPSISVTNANTPSKNFIDISSHNGSISVANFQKIKNYGVTGVVVKLTEATSYINPQAQSQITNAKAAGLKVSAYHYSWFTSDKQAAAEADYFAAAAKKFGLDGSTVMVNDIEEPQIAGKGNHTSNSKAFENRLKALGYSNVRHYIGLSWIGNRINAATIGNKNIWVAAYPYNLSTTNFYTQYGAWQWSAQLSFPGINGNFDINADYTGTFSTKPSTTPSNSVPMYRLYNPNSSEHFYTQNSYEKTNLVSKGWRYEGLGWYAPTSGSPVYRLYNPNAGDHHYTLHAYEKNDLVKKGWRYEGVSWYSGGGNVLYRLYNKNAKAGAHHYTLNTYERDNLVKSGWRYEGIAWNAK